MAAIPVKVIDKRSRALAFCFVIGCVLAACSATTVSDVSRTIRTPSVTKTTSVTRTTSMTHPCETTFPGSICSETTTPPNTFAQAVPLGTPVAVSKGEAFSARVVVTHVITNLAVSSLISDQASMPVVNSWAASQQWVGIELSVTNTSENDSFGYLGTESTPAPTFSVNGKALLAESSTLSPAQPRDNSYLTAASLGEIGFAKCPLLNVVGLSQGATANGCIALPVDPGHPATTVGVGITVTEYQFGIPYSQWNV